ncbi:MAG: photosystem I reaction center subunit PsaK, partial [Oscillatoriales cyanobacterium RU_3_3]|nr:photosystem I reaction center subunit PsaK [Oscillatoriales cyanobacterium RU_3_3]
MINSSLILAIQSAAPATPEWTPMVGLTMILCNLLAIAIGYWGIKKESRGKG